MRVCNKCLEEHYNLKPTELRYLGTCRICKHFDFNNYFTIDALKKHKKRRNNERKI